MNAVRTGGWILVSLLAGAGGCTPDSVIGDWHVDPTVAPHGLNGRLALEEDGTAHYVSNGASGLAIVSTVEGEWLTLAPANGVPRYEIRLGCRPPGTIDAKGKCSGDVWVHSQCSLEDDSLSCPDGTIEGAHRFLRTSE